MLTLLFALVGQALPPSYPAPYNPYDLTGAIGGGMAIVCNDTTCRIGAGTIGTPTASTNIGGSSVAADHGTSIGQAANANINSVAIGQGSSAGGANSTAVGSGASAANANSTVLGQGASGSNTDTTVIGIAASATTDKSTAVGGTAQATGLKTTSLGYNTRSSGNYAVTLGAESWGNANNITVVGYSAGNNGADSVVVGYSAAGFSADCTTVGSISRCGGGGSTGGVAVGKSAYANGTDSIAIGRAAQLDTTATRAIGIGAAQPLSGYSDTLVLGYGAGASSNNQAVFGSGTHPYGYHLYGQLLDLRSGNNMDHWYSNYMQVSDVNSVQTTFLGQDAYPQATTAAKQQGGSIRVMGGMGARAITVNGFATSEGDTYQLVSGGITKTYTARNPGPPGANEFACITSDIVCATNLKAVVDADFSAILATTRVANVIYYAPLFDHVTSSNMIGSIAQTVTDAGGGGAFGVATNGARGDSILGNSVIVARETHIDTLMIEQLAIPATCSIGQIRMSTGVTKKLCYCQAVNTWYCATLAVGP